MDKIERAVLDEEQPIGSIVVDKINDTKRRAKRKFINYSGFFVGAFLIFAVVLFFTTEINFSSVMDWAKLGLTFVILLFCSYAMYVNFSDSGIRAGKTNDAYVKIKDEHDRIKKSIVSEKKQWALSDFCKWYIAEEMKSLRESILENEGINYDFYAEQYIGKDKEELMKDESLSEIQVKAIVKANNIKPIKLTPEMIMKRGRGSGVRNPLSISPSLRKNVHYIVKFVQTAIISVVTGIIAFDVVASPTWATFVTCFVKLLPFVLSGFTGYKMGYENVTVDTVNYMNDQIDLMQQFLQYVEKFQGNKEENLVYKIE